MREQDRLRVEIHRSELDVGRKMLARCAILGALQSRCEVLHCTRLSVQRGLAIVCSRLRLSNGAAVPGQKLPVWKGMVLMRTDLVRLVGFVLGHEMFEMFQIQCFLGQAVTQVTLIDPLVVWKVQLGH